MKTILFMVALIAISMIPYAYADEAEIESIRQSLKTISKDMEPDSIKKAPAKDLYEITFGPQVFYMTRDGRYLIQGDMLDIKTRENVTETRKNSLRKEAISNVSEDSMVIFPSKDPKHTVTVFTDVDCGYCRKLHSEIKEINKRGITVRYLFFPRTGPNSPSYYKAESVWCADDRQQALTDAKAGKKVEDRRCDNPIDEHLALVSALGLRGTPAIVLEDGTLVPGYMPASKLAALVNGETH
jgi:thiol:disulfide interchange protein DsbC